MGRKRQRSHSLGSPEWREMLLQGAAGFNVHLTALQVDQLSLHAAELAQWNRKVNLTTITSPGEMAVKHFIDSLAVAHRIPMDALLLDMGSGGGFPGLPLKIVRPDLTITLIDAARKKISFLSHVIRTLGLTRIDARHVRAEVLAKEKVTKHFQVIVCRALTSLDHFIELADPLLAEQGLLMAWKTPALKNERPEWGELLATEGEVKGPSGSVYTLSRADYPLPDGESKRTLVMMRRR